MALAAPSLLASLSHAAWLSPHSSVMHHPINTTDTGDIQTVNFKTTAEGCMCKPSTVLAPRGVKQAFPASSTA